MEVNEPYNDEIINNTSKSRSKTSTERVREFRDRKKLVAQNFKKNNDNSRGNAKTSTERSRIFRERKKFKNLNEIFIKVEQFPIESEIIDNCTQNSEVNTGQHYTETNAYETQNKIIESNFSERSPKTPAERSREYRKRRKLTSQDLKKSEKQSIDSLTISNEQSSGDIEIFQHQVQIHSNNTRTQTISNVSNIKDEIDPQFTNAYRISIMPDESELNEIRQSLDNEPINFVRNNENVTTHKEHIANKLFDDRNKRNMTSLAEIKPPDDTNKRFYICHPKQELKTVICIICEDAYHRNDFDRLSNVKYVGENLVICPLHVNVRDIASQHHEEKTLGETSKIIITQIKMRQTEDLRKQILAELTNETQELHNNKTHSDSTVETEMVMKENTLLKQLNKELQEKNEQLIELLDTYKSKETDEQVTEKSYAKITSVVQQQLKQEI